MKSPLLGVIELPREVGKRTDAGLFLSPGLCVFLLTFLNQYFRTIAFQDSREKKVMRRAGKILLN
jgi:hypothetical protein